MIKKIVRYLFLLNIAGITIFPQTMLEKGYIAPTILYSPVNGQGAVLPGGKALWLLDNHIGIGGSVFISANSIKAPFTSQNGDPYSMTMTLGGLHVEYLSFPEKNIMLTFDLAGGSGSVEFHAPDNGILNPDRDPRAFLYLEPNIHIGYALSDYSAITIGAGYRFISNYAADGELPRNKLEGVAIDLNISTNPRKIANHSGFAAPVLKSTAVNGQSALLLGGKGMWVMDGQFGLGAGIYVTTNTIGAPINDQNGNPYSLTLSYGGLHTAYFFYPAKDVLITCDMFCAGADVKYSEPKDGIASKQFYPVQFLIWEPQLSVGYSLSDYVSVSLGASYRFLSQYMTYYDLKKKDLQGMASNLTFIFGKFR